MDRVKVKAVTWWKVPGSLKKNDVYVCFSLG